MISILEHQGILHYQGWVNMFLWEVYVNNPRLRTNFPVYCYADTQVEAEAKVQAVHKNRRITSSNKLARKEEIIN